MRPPPTGLTTQSVLSSAEAVIGIDGSSMFLREPLLGSSLSGMFLREPLPLFTVPRDVCATTGAIPPFPALTCATDLGPTTTLNLISY